MPDLGSILRNAGSPTDDSKKQVDPRDQEIADLKKQLTELTKAVSGMQNTPRNIPTAHQSSNGSRFVGRRELADAYDDPNTLADLLDNAFQQFYQNIQGLVPNSEKLTEQLIQTVNENLDDRIASRVVIDNAVADFYRENKELIPFKANAGVIANRLQAENPGLSIHELLNKTKEELNKEYGDLIEAAKNKATDGAGKDNSKGATPNHQPDDGAATNGKGEPNLSPMAAAVARYRNKIPQVAAQQE